MYDNIGGKIKGLATAQCLIGALISIFAGMALVLNREALLGLVVMILGSLCSWIFSFLIYGFGELIEKTAQIERNTRTAQKGTSDTIKPTPRASMISNTSNATSLKK